MARFGILQFLVLFTPHVWAASNSKTSLTLVYQNNLNASDDVNHVGFILLDPMDQRDAAGACAAIGESLVSRTSIQTHQADFVHSLSYLAYSGSVHPHQSYQIQNGTVTMAKAGNGTTFQSVPARGRELPVLCTQSSNQDQPGTAVATKSNELTISSGGNTYIGFRNQKSFRFLGIPYADPPQRYVYSTLYTPTGKTINATAYGSVCAQAGSGSEDCLFLNIQTPYLPKHKSTARLRPVMFWIHGGGFVNGAGSDPASDGGNLASREDIVVVTVNYRVSTLGFLAIPGTNITGNYGIADQITALEWTIKNIASFGGDPRQITIIGESAGAGSVRTLLGSPPANGKFQGAVAMSNLGGGVDLGLSRDYATTYSSYLTVAASYARAGQNIFAEAGCNQTDLPAQIACLNQVPALTLVGYSIAAAYVVQDGYYVNTEQLDVVNANGSAAYVPVIFGVTANDGASFASYPSTPVTSEVAGIEASLGISASAAQSIIDSGLFPYYDTGNVTLDAFNVSQRVATDNEFRCVDQATVYAAAHSGAFPAAYFYQMQRTIAGYDPNHLGGPAATPGFPAGNPHLPYFRLHGADMPWVFGNLATIREPADLFSVQLTTAYFGAFVKKGDPNPAAAALRVRGYDAALKAIDETGLWDPVSGADGPIRLLDYPAVASGFIDLPQCAWLNYSISYYLDGGS
ncbi:carboxylic ester hydrolase-7 [Coleophoma crateriformis]|uniref:Carboxylic ester hydrolase n=1 Tax=Coleophoma crateriformis TaxID=565419 RepID=A0A3D8SLY9_9HELO|nr:carboxylic ester hydrolase-7 [Coleophoma crateriformis]